MLYTPLSPSQLSHLLTSQGLFFPHGFQQLRLLKGRPDTQGSVEKEPKSSTISNGHARLLIFVSPCWLAKPLRFVLIWVKSVLDRRPAGLKHLPTPDGCLKNLHMTEGSIQCSAPESEPCQHLWVQCLTFPFSAASARGKDSSSSSVLKACWRVRLIPLSICGLCRLDVGFQMAAWAEMFPPLSSPTFLFPCWSFPSEASNSAIRLTCWDITISMSYKMAKAESSDEKIEESLQRSKSLWSCHQTLSLPFESPQQMPFIWRWPGSFRSL